MLPKMITYECEVCGKEKTQKEYVYNKSEHHYCSNSCLSIAKMKSKKHLGICEVCGKPIVQKESYYKRNIHHYCSRECSIIGRHRLKSESRFCEFCGAEFQVIKSNPKKFCSMKCQNDWQKTQVGVLSSHYKRVEVKCDWCNKLFPVIPSKLTTQERHFCSTQCCRDWYAKEYSQSDAYREKSRNRALAMLKSGMFSQTNSKPQSIINDILTEMGIKYINEYKIGNYCIDNYLVDYGCPIEVMGDYWHCSPRKYSRPINTVQIGRIQKDRSKTVAVQRITNKQILYLWEYDILHNIDICKMLIDEYIHKSGILPDYNSFNYKLKDGILIEEKLYTPYHELSEEEFDELINDIA